MVLSGELFQDSFSLSLSVLLTQWVLRSAWPRVSTKYIFFLSFLGLHLQHMEVPRLGVELELQPKAYTTVTATRDP